jgi:hypothetical protein
VIFKNFYRQERQRTKEGMNRSVDMGQNQILFLSLFLNIFLGVLAVQNQKG